jgi:signal transduction histidine kinase
MLCPLHGVLLAHPDSLAGKGLFLIHVGLFLLWQPLVSAERVLSWRESVTGLGFAGILGWFLDWWLLAFWLASLLALLGGRQLVARHTDWFRSCLLGYLLASLLLWIGPHMVQELPPNLVMLVTLYAMPTLVMLSGLMQASMRQHTNERALDFVYSLLLFLLISFILLGSIAYSLAWRTGYFLGLTQIVLIAGIAILALSWLWRPHAGFQGISVLFSSYLLSLGSPFEEWISSLAALARSESSADTFLKQACEELNQLDWVIGARWSSENQQGMFGRESSYSADFCYPPLNLTLYSNGSLSPTLLLHGKLLTQVLSEYYIAKRREQTLRANTYTQAIHETGARLTHDIKNLLQTLKTLCSVTASEQSDDPQALAELIRRQLPQIAQRLEDTLLKLKTPTETQIEFVPANMWFAQIQRRYQHQKITFSISKMRDIDSVPAHAFDSICDNLLQNALDKRNREPGIEIALKLFWRNGICLEISDNGSAIKEEIRQSLLSAPVPSSNGLGVGLYQAAHLAQQQNYRLALIDNNSGHVRFSVTQVS